MTEMGSWSEKILRGFIFLDLVLFDFVLSDSLEKDIN